MRNLFVISNYLELSIIPDIFTIKYCIKCDTDVSKEIQIGNQ